MHTSECVYRDGDLECRGYVAWDDSVSGPRPGVLVSHAWAGLGDFERQRANALAEMGYVGFAVDVYGGGRTGADKDENAALMTPFLEDRAMLRRRMLAGCEAMCSLDSVDSGRCGAIGYCFGGLCVLDLARAGADVGGVVSFHGLLMGAEGLSNESIQARMLILHGASDPMVPDEQVAGFRQEMDGAGADWQIHMYGGAMHAFTNPSANDPDFGTVYSADADRRSWQAMGNFFNELF